MSGHDVHRADAAAYALGALTPPESADLERHLQRCEACGADLERFRAVVETLPMTVEPLAARAQLKQEVLQRVRDSERAERSKRRSRMGVPAPPRPALVAALVLASAALVAGGHGLGPSRSGDGRPQLRVMVDRARAPGLSAMLHRLGDMGVLRMLGLAPLDGGVYVLWVDRGSGPVFASSFDPEPAGTADVGVWDLRLVEHMMVTREASARAARPSGRAILTVRPE